MSITRRLEQILEYISDAVSKIFSPTHDDYPTIGVQPFKGEPFKDKARGH